jgi:hypothetical protein
MIVGGWAQRPSGEITWELLEDVGSEAAEAIGRQAAELQLWFGDRVVTARFRSPSDRDLAAE